jgi:hypothetical protein
MTCPGAGFGANVRRAVAGAADSSNDQLPGN